MFNMGAEVQKSGDYDRIKKEIKAIKEIKLERLSNIDIIINK